MTDKKISEKHTAKVGKMCYIAVGTERRQKFDGSVSHHEILGFEGYGGKKEHDAFVGESHAEGKEDAIACAGSSDSVPHVEVFSYRDDSSSGVDKRIISHPRQIVFGCLPHFLAKAGTHTTDKVIKEITLLRHGLLDDTAEHPQRKHVQQHMAP